MALGGLWTKGVRGAHDSAGRLPCFRKRGQQCRSGYKMCGKIGRPTNKGQGSVLREKAEDGLPIEYIECLGEVNLEHGTRVLLAKLLYKSSACIEDGLVAPLVMTTTRMALRQALARDVRCWLNH